jgi:HNH endonuclease
MIDDTTRQTIRDRAAGCCEYCRLPQVVSGLLPFHVEHIRGKQHRGSDELDNLCYACSRCNHYKGPNLSSYDPLTDRHVPLFHPRRDVWSHHFEFEGPLILGITPEGRATVELLQMNDSRRVNLRALLFGEGEY